MGKRDQWYNPNNSNGMGEIEQSEKLPEQDNERYETETQQTIERLYYSWLGMIPDPEGIYKRDYRLKRLMNEKCASMLRSEITSTFNDNMNYSSLETTEIEEFASYTSELCMNRMKYNFEDYEIEVEDLVPIAFQIYRSLKIWLNIAKEGGMKQYKVMRGAPRMINPHPVPPSNDVY